MNEKFKIEDVTVIVEDIRESLKQDTENAEECTGMKHDGKEESVHQDLEERENTMDTDDGTNRIGQMSKLLLFGKKQCLMKYFYLSV